MVEMVKRRLPHWWSEINIDGKFECGFCQGHDLGIRYTGYTKSKIKSFSKFRVKILFKKIKRRFPRG